MLMSYGHFSHGTNHLSTGKIQFVSEIGFIIVEFNPVALRTAKTSWRFRCSECNRVKYFCY